MNKFERVMREERWMLTEELFLPGRSEPPEVVAYRMLREDEWIDFMFDVSENPSLKFFNPELREFSHARTWVGLSEQYGVRPFSDELAIPQGVPEEVQDFCRELRNSLRQAEEDTGCGGCKAFYAPEEWVDPVRKSVLLVVCHDGGAMAPRFNLDYEQYKLYDSIDPMLKSRGLWRDHMNSAVSHVYRMEQQQQLASFDITKKTKSE